MPTVAELAAEVSVEGVGKATADLGTFDSAVRRSGAGQAAAAKQSLTHEQKLDKVGKASLIAGGAILVGMGMAVKATLGFDREMSGVAAVADASAQGLANLRQAAIEAGAATSFSASEAAKAESELAKAGVSVGDILGGALRGSLDLAAAGQLDLADAATISAQAMKIFGLEGRDVSHIADVLAAGANKSAADVSDLAQALGQGGLVASQTGMELEDTVGVLSLFADNALRGSDAGTSLKTMLQRLTPQSAEAKRMMDQLGISAFDSQGQFIGLAKFAGQLHDRLGGLSTQQRNTALTTIFGADAIRAAGILMDAGAGGVRDYTKAVNDQGAAGRMAATQLDNLSGDLEELSGSIETALIKSGSMGTAALRGLAQGATGAVNAFAGLPGPVQAAGVATVAASGGILTLVGASIKLHQWLGKVEEVSPRAATALRGLGVASAVVGGIVALKAGVEALGGQFTVTSRSAVRLRDDLSGVGVAKLAAELDEMVPKLRRLGVSSEQAYGQMFDAALKQGVPSAQAVVDALDKLGVKTDDYRRKIAAKTDAEARAANATDRHATEVDKAKAALAGAPGALGATTDALAGQEQQLGETTSELDRFKAAMDKAFGANISATQAQLDFSESLLTVKEQLRQGQFALSNNTAAGVQNQQTLLGLAQKAKDHAAAVIQQTGSVAAGTLTLAGHLNELVAVEMQTGKSRDEALAYTATLLGIPPSAMTNVKNTADIARLVVDAYKTGSLDPLKAPVVTPVDVDTSRADEKLDALVRKYGTVSRALAAGAGSITGRGSFTFGDGRQHGGPIPGPKDQPVPIVAHGGEYVLSADVVDRIKRGAPSKGATAGMVPPPLASSEVHNHYEIGSLQAVDPRALAVEVAREIAWKQMVAA